MEFLKSLQRAVFAPEYVTLVVYFWDDDGNAVDSFQDVDCTVYNPHPVLIDIPDRGDPEPVYFRSDQFPARMRADFQNGLVACEYLGGEWI